jgi:hypothetical protein
LRFLGVSAPDAVHTARIYWLDTALDNDAVAKVAHDLFSDRWSSASGWIRRSMCGIGQHRSHP